MLVSHRIPAPQRPRVVGEEILLGKTTRLARLVSVRGCWEIEDWPEDALRALLTQAYGPSEAALQSLVKAVRDATYFLPRNPPQAARVLQGLPEPLTDADPRLTQAERLLKAGADPRSLATAMRREGLNLRPAPAWSDRLTLCDKGVVLGHGTVIVDLADHADGSTGLAVEGNEANILALLSVASGRLASPDALEKLASASRSLAKGNVAQAAIALCHIGQPSLEDQDLAKGLEIVASYLNRGHNLGDVMKACGLTKSHLRDVDGCGINLPSNLGKYNSLHYPANSGRGGQFAPKEGADYQESVHDKNGIEASDEKKQRQKNLQRTQDQHFPPIIMRLADGSTVISPYDKNPIQMPSDVSLEDNARIGEFFRNSLKMRRKKLCYLYLFIISVIWTTREIIV